MKDAHTAGRNSERDRTAHDMTGTRHMCVRIRSLCEGDLERDESCGSAEAADGCPGGTATVQTDCLRSEASAHGISDAVGELQIFRLITYDR